MKKTNLLATVLLVANLVIFAAYGVGFLIAQQALASRLDITLGSASALADFRAMYAGLCLAVATIFILGLRFAQWRRQAVVLATLGAGGLAVGRLTSIAIDGLPGPLVLAFLASELAALALGTFILMQGAESPAVGTPPLYAPTSGGTSR